MKIYDYHIRELLFKEFGHIEEFTSDPSNKVISELDVCFGISRIDIAVINGKLHGFEIKSERDTLERLPSQMKVYNRVFDTITIVAAENHIKKIIKNVPEYWGIYCVAKDRGKLALEIERTGDINHETDSFCLAQFLWKPELLELLGTKGTKSKTRFALCKIVADTVNEQVVKEYVREKLKSRKDWRAVPVQQLCDDLLQ
jgi:hypothetical protein